MRFSILGHLLVMVAFVCQAPSASCALDMYRTESTNISEKNKDSHQIKKHRLLYTLCFKYYIHSFEGQSIYRFH